MAKNGKIGANEKRFCETLDEIVAVCKGDCSEDKYHKLIFSYDYSQYVDDDDQTDVYVTNRGRIFAERILDSIVGASDYFKKVGKRYVACNTPKLELYQFLVDEGFPLDYLTSRIEETRCKLKKKYSGGKAR